MIHITLFPPAKVNLYLVVRGLRSDGYHEIGTLFERLDFTDELYLERKAVGISMTCSDSSVPTDERNLVLRAARAFYEAMGIREGMTAHLVKRIPVAGGLGGGSSDAASTLVGLNLLYDQPLGLQELMKIGGRLGADVPFFVWGQPFAWGEGRGDRLTPVARPSAPLWHVLVNPGVPIFTQAVYDLYDRKSPPPLRLTPSVEDVTMLRRVVQEGDAGRLSLSLANALELSAEASCPAIRAVKAALSFSGALGAVVSGSGPTAFGLARDEKHALDIEARIRRERPEWMVLSVPTALALPDGRRGGASLGLRAAS